MLSQLNGKVRWA